MPKTTRAEYIAKKRRQWAKTESQHSNSHNKHKHYRANVHDQIKQKRNDLDQQQEINTMATEAPLNQKYTTARLQGAPYQFTTLLRPKDFGRFVTPVPEIQKIIEKRLGISSDDLRYEGNIIKIPTDDLANIELIDYLLKLFISRGNQGSITIKF